MSGQAFIGGLGTVRECRHCGALVAGGPTACMHCTKTWVRIGNTLNDVLVSAFHAVRRLIGRRWS